MILLSNIFLLVITPIKKHTKIILSKLLRWLIKYEIFEMDIFLFLDLTQLQMYFKVIL